MREIKKVAACSNLYSSKYKINNAEVERRCYKPIDYKRIGGCSPTEAEALIQINKKLSLSILGGRNKSKRLFE